MKQYDNYKNSGVEWLGEIPEHWEVKKMKFIGNIYAGINGKKGDDFSKEYSDGIKSFIPFTNICNNIKIDNNQYQYVKISENENQNRVKKNDILFLMSSETLDDIAKNSIYLGENTELYLNSFCKGFRISKHNVNAEFVNYLFLSTTYRNYFSLVGRGFTRINLKQEFINDAYALLPKLKEQTAIANFLDNKTTKIDQAIAIKQQQIALLQEHRQILIHKAVTRGLNENVKLKDSGVEWIGEIPEHWEVKKLGYLTNKIGDGLHGTPNYTDGTEFYFINGNNLSTGNIEITELTKTVSEREYLIHKKELTDKTLLLSINGTIGNVAFYCGEKVMLGKSAAYLNFYKNINIEYVKCFLESTVFKNYYELQLSGSTINNFSLYSIGKTPVTFPNKIEQKQIVEYIKTSKTKIATAISLKEQEIVKLKEYKMSLIDGVVTGKVRVIS